MRFEYPKRRKASAYAQRSVVMAKRGMVASSHVLASQSGLKVLLRGGNAVDAAVAMLFTLSVVEPHSVGLGGDAFALIWKAKERVLVGLNGSGRAPLASSIEWFKERGMNAIPERGILSVTVPGALRAWADALERCGTMTLSQVMEDAIVYAEEGFPVTEIIAGEWESAKETLERDEEGARVFLPGGRPPRPGEVFRNPDLARTLKRLEKEGVESFYEGPIGEAIVAASRKRGGLLSMEDLKSHKSAWVHPVSTIYRGYEVWELPPNGQGVVALEMLNILEGYPLGDLEHNGPEHIHLLVEAKKAAFEDRDTLLGDPLFGPVPIEAMLSKERAADIRSRISMTKASPPSFLQPSAPGSDTVYVCAVDANGNAASFISSIFMHFGSGVVVEGTGLVLQNRGHAFRLDPSHPNSLLPGKRPLHTIIPAMLFKDGNFIMSFGVMGGDMQPQGHVQFLVNVIDFAMNLQEALDSPRVRHLQGMRVYLEEGIPGKTRSALKAMGHEVEEGEPQVNQVGGGQAIYRDPETGVLLGASDRRKDGCAIGF